MKKIFTFILFVSFVLMCYSQENVLTLNMDEGSGNTLNDLSGYNNNGSVVGTVPIVSGKYGNARSFSGGSYIEVPNSTTIVPTSAITIECWVNTSNLAYGTLVRKSDGGQVSGYMLFLDNSGKPSFALIRSSSPINCYGQKAIQPNTWTHVAGTFDGSQLKVYVNGVLSGNENYSGLIEQSDSPLGIGAVPRTSGNDPFTGLIDEVKIFNYAKTNFDVGANNANILTLNFDEGSGIVANDVSGNGNNGTVNNAIWTQGKQNNALDFNGTSSYVLINHSSTLNPVNQITMESWIYPRSISGSSHYIISKGESNPWKGYHLRIINGKIDCWFGSSPTPVTSISSILPNQWTHVAATYDGSKYRIFINGTLDVEGTTSYDFNTSQNLCIGKNSDANDFFDGKIDEVKIFNYAKTSFDLGPDNANVLSLNMDESSGNILGDISGYNNNGTVVGTVPTVSGKYGNARSFTGGSSGSYINVNNSQSISPANAITVECWVNPTNITQSVSIIRKSNGGQVAGYQLALYYQGKITFQLIRSTTPITVTGNSPLTPNIWTHIAGTYDGNTLKVFVNGVLDGTTDYVGTIEQSTSPLGIGAVPRTYNNDGFSGLIDEVKIFNYAKIITNIDRHDENTFIHSFVLTQNFPNPFNPNTVIKYTLPYESKVIVTIYNTLGEIVKTFNEEIKTAGYYDINFSGEGLCSGVYFYRLSAESLDGKQKYSSMKKMILLK